MKTRNGPIKSIGLEGWPLPNVRFPPIADMPAADDNDAMGTVERAFQLVASCRTMDELRAQLVREGHTNIDAHLQGSLRRDLKKLLKKSA